VFDGIWKWIFFYFSISDFHKIVLQVIFSSIADFIIWV